MDGNDSSGGGGGGAVGGGTNSNTHLYMYVCMYVPEFYEVSSNNLLNNTFIASHLGDVNADVI